jgi:hypothetical protein
LSDSFTSRAALSFGGPRSLFYERVVRSLLEVHQAMLALPLYPLRCAHVSSFEFVVDKNPAESVPGFAVNPRGRFARSVGQVRDARSTGETRSADNGLPL